MNWREDRNITDCKRVDKGNQSVKTVDYGTTYVSKVLDDDPIRDWESISRCIDLWNFCMKNIDTSDLDVLDCGTKDCQFPQWLKDKKLVRKAVGMEISPKYVEYASKKGRSIIYGDVCDILFRDNTFDIVFSHHLLGLVRDYQKALDEMFRVTKIGGYMITLNQCPGNKRKHYSYIDSPQIFHDFTVYNNCTILYNGYIKNEYTNEWVLFLKKES